MKYYRDIASIVEPYLYLGGNFLNKRPHYAELLGFTHVLNVADTVIPNRKLFKYLREYMHIHADDSLDYFIRFHFEQAFQVIDNARLSNGKVLVHCKKGKSRSATIVIAYLMCRYRLPFALAFEYVRCRKNNINPNDYFMQLLQEYDEELRAREYFSII